MIDIIAALFSVAYLPCIVIVLWAQYKRMWPTAIGVITAGIIAQLIALPLEGLTVVLDGATTPKIIGLTAGGANLAMALWLRHRFRESKALADLHESWGWQR